MKRSHDLELLNSRESKEGDSTPTLREVAFNQAKFLDFLVVGELAVAPLRTRRDEHALARATSERVACVTTYQGESLEPTANREYK